MRRALGSLRPWAALAAAALNAGCGIGSAAAQPTGSNLLIGQVGALLPRSSFDRGPSNRQNFYEQLNLEYAYASGLIGVRFEGFRSSEKEFPIGQEMPYAGISQRFADWTDGRYRLRVGNFYTIVGRGLAHRSFELTGVVLDKPGSHARYAPSRDVDGVLAEANAGPLSASLFSGSPTDGTVTLGEETSDNQRHRGQISGGQLATTVYREARVGVGYLRNQAGFNPRRRLARQEEIGTGFVEFDPLRVLGIGPLSLPLYFEYATKNRTFGEWWDFRTGRRTSHALYADANLLWGAFGFSAEWKDYADFRLGTNDPPSLVREQSQALLNRSTHVLDAQAEEGFQLEASYAVSGWLTAIANLSRSDDTLGHRFVEHYAELHAAPRGAERWDATLFYDSGRDGFTSVEDRRTYGAATTVRVVRGFSGTIDFQRQTGRRIPLFRHPRYENVYLSWTAAAADLGSLAMVWERTTDELDPSFPSGRTRPLHLISWILNARLTPRHDATLFVGQRRGGLACTAGTCYEVQPFEGAELRLVSRF